MDLDQLALSKASLSGSSLFSKVGTVNAQKFKL